MAPARRFQSRVGFLPRRDRSPQSAPCTAHGFNPVLGFYRVATMWPHIIQEMQTEMFQSRVGFLPRRDPCTSSPSASASNVSIPCWVSTASRRHRASAGAPSRRFNPVLGFYRVATRPQTLENNRLNGFNPVLGFYRVATSSAPHAPEPPIRVSIPCWVSTASRRSPDECSATKMKFQSRVGFLPRRDRSASDFGFTENWFQSRVGFLPRRDPREVLATDADILFQSRVGFLPRRDEMRDNMIEVAKVFQSRVGFLPRRDQLFPPSRTRLEFQSRVGFLPRRDRILAGLCSTATPVSIPCWVSTASRPPTLTHPPHPQSCFNPVLGFYRVATVHTTLPFRVWPGFNPVLGFYRVATSQPPIRIRYSTMFQSRVGFLPRRDPRHLSSSDLPA